MNYEKWRMHYETLPDGTRAQVRDGYTMRNGYYTRDGHGGHGFEHRQEMRQIALETIKEVVPQMIEEMCVQICTAALEDVIGAIEWDIEEVINVSFDDMHNVFNSEKFRKVLLQLPRDDILFQFLPDVGAVILPNLDNAFYVAVNRFANKSLIIIASLLNQQA